MPFIVDWPGVTKPGSVNEDDSESRLRGDVFGHGRSAIPADMQGRSLVPLLEGTRPMTGESIYYHYYEFPSVHMVARHYGIRTERYKLIHFYQFDEWELYDLKHDPDELTNEYNNPDYISTIADLKLHLDALRKQYKDDSE